MKTMKKTILIGKAGRNDKKAFLKTIEVVIAFVITFIFITFITASKSSTDVIEPNIKLIDIQRYNPDFRDCVIAENISCLNETLRAQYSDFTEFNSYMFNITTDPYSRPPTLPVKEIHLESLFIEGNNTYAYPRIVRLYYWI